MRQLASADEGQGSELPQAESIASRNLLMCYILTLLPVVLYISIRTVNFFAEVDFPRHTFGTLYTAFFCTFGLFLLVPIDVASTIRDRHANAQDGSPNKYLDDTSVLHDIYLSLYITLQV